jgi:hypothetical protein
MRHVPWITFIIVAVFAVSPFGQSLYHSAFVSGEQLANNIAQFVLMIIVGIAIGLAALEWGVKFLIRKYSAKHRAKGAALG